MYLLTLIDVAVSGATCYGSFKCNQKLTPARKRILHHYFRTKDHYHFHVHFIIHRLLNSSLNFLLLPSMSPPPVALYIMFYQCYEICVFFFAL